MKKILAALLTTTVFLPAIAAAQIKTLMGETVTVSATVDAIERSSRSLTLRAPDGKLTTITVPADVKRFDALKVGDTLTAKYYENIVVRVKQPGEKDVDSASGGVTKSGGQKPGATVAAQRTITATVTAIDPKIPSISLSGPNNWTYSSRVADKKALAQVKVGDRLDLTWTEAVLISAEAPKSK